jgi:hypothetical protein
MKRTAAEAEVIGTTGRERRGGVREETKIASLAKGGGRREGWKGGGGEGEGEEERDISHNRRERD